MSSQRNSLKSAVSSTNHLWLDQVREIVFTSQSKLFPLENPKKVFNLELKKSTRQWVEFYLRKAKMVNWDRFIPVALGKGIGVYGWIEREKDSYKDFAYVEFDLEKHEIPYFISSSAKHSTALGEILVKGKSEHNLCERVEHNFEIKNSIKLKNHREKYGN